jgi:hypothetical protein
MTGVNLLLLPRWVVMKYLLLIILLILVIIPFYEHDNSFSCRHDPDALSNEIAQGKAYYFRVFVECKASFNDDELDGLYRASGIFLKKQPQEFIRVISEFDIEGRELRDLAIKMPLEISGNTGRKHAEIEERIRLVQGLANSEAKSKVLDVLFKELGR